MFYILAAILIIFFLSSSIRVAKENEKIVVFRLGRFLNIKEPGFVLIVPIIDKCIKVDLSEKVPGWQALSKLELDEKSKSLVM